MSGSNDVLQHTVMPPYRAFRGESGVMPQSAGGCSPLARVGGSARNDGAVATGNPRHEPSGTKPSGTRARALRPGMSAQRWSQDHRPRGGRDRPPVSIGRARRSGGPAPSRRIAATSPPRRCAALSARRIGTNVSQ